MLKSEILGTSTMVQWLQPHAPNAGDMGSIPGWGTRFPHAAQHGHKKREKETLDFLIAGRSSKLG